MSEDMSRLAQHLDLQAQRLRIDLKVARLFVGTTDTGNVAENAVRRFLDSHLSARYSVGVGEAVAASGERPPRVAQTQQKDVIIYDPYGCATLGWGEGGVGLFPVESIYATVEVKTSLSSSADLLGAVDQALEVKKLCQAAGSRDRPPFTSVFAFESRIRGESLFSALRDREPEGRPDFVLILEPTGAPEDHSQYFAHWHYFSRGGGLIAFVTASQAAQEKADYPEHRDKFLTFAESGSALLWFYLFLIEQLESMRLEKPDLLAYAGASRGSLGWRGNE